MTRRSKFEIMRARRTGKPVKALIDEVEAEIDREWADLQRKQAEERSLRFSNSSDWLRDTRDQAREKEKRAPEPGLLHVLAVMVANYTRRFYRRVA